jgi:hypothetical protein
MIGAVAVLAAAWITHGPLGQGDAFMARLQEEAQAVLAEAGTPRVQVRFERSPLVREAVLSGQANDFQRNGMGSLPGINGRIDAIAGVGGVHWEGEGPAAWRVPLLAETQLIALIVYFAGVGLSWLVFRPRREGFL